MSRGCWVYPGAVVPIFYEPKIVCQRIIYPPTVVPVVIILKINGIRILKIHLFVFVVVIFVVVQSVSLSLSLSLSLSADLSFSVNDVSVY